MTITKTITKRVAARYAAADSFPLVLKRYSKNLWMTEDRKYSVERRGMRKGPDTFMLVNLRSGDSQRLDSFEEAVQVIEKKTRQKVRVR